MAVYLKTLQVIKGLESLFRNKKLMLKILQNCHTFEIDSTQAWPFAILQNDNITISWDFFRLTALAAMLGHLCAVQISLFEFYESV